MMKSLSVGLCLVLLASTCLYALDQVAFTRLEESLSPYLGESDAKVLIQSQEKLTQALKQKPLDVELNLARGIVEHNLALALQKKKILGHPAKAVEVLEALLARSNPGPEARTIALSYLGSAWTLWGNEAENPVHKINHVKKGLGVLDEAVKVSEGSYYLPRYIRANVSLSLPDFFETLEKAGQDLVFIEKTLKNNRDYLPQTLHGDYYLMLGTYYRKNRQLDRAMVAWKASLAADPQQKGPGKDAAKALDTYGD